MVWTIWRQHHRLLHTVERTTTSNSALTQTSGLPKPTWSMHCYGSPLLQKVGGKEAVHHAFWDKDAVQVGLAEAVRRAKFAIELRALVKRTEPHVPCHVHTFHNLL